MNSIEIPELKIKRYIPSNLAECTSQQYIDMCELMLQLQSNIISFDDLKIQAVYKLLNMKAKNQNKIDEDKITNVLLLGELVESFFETNEHDQKTIIQNYIHNPVPYYKPIYTTYYGPADQFTNITFGEYLDALRLFHQFNATGQIQNLYLLTAILYRKKKILHFIKKHLQSYDGDIRQKYNHNFVEKRAKIFSKFPIGFSYGTYLLFASFQKFISSAQVPWAGRTLDLSILFQTEQADNMDTIENDDIGMDAVMFTMAESGVFGSPTELKQTSLWLILVRLYDSRIKDLQLKKQEENAQSNTP